MLKRTVVYPISLASLRSAFGAFRASKFWQVLQKFCVTFSTCAVIVQSHVIPGPPSRTCVRISYTAFCSGSKHSWEFRASSLFPFRWIVYLFELRCKCSFRWFFWALNNSLFLGLKCGICVYHLSLQIWCAKFEEPWKQYCGSIALIAVIFVFTRGITVWKHSLFSVRV